ncbi:ParB/RepB/Spo0J family partition protein [Alloalcanivorax venustensis]|jgi:ParB family chromosome partitioning protein|uniref:ParB/RepB/Spo0J family partition protein n=1 Tax=Alloalcanivorax TaxID=3020832 RepID=UPI000793736E|nr:MAG: chromosome partitioning protein ParB [Alcanivorax sp. Nap_24]MAD69213.1 chromosome partitioning protein ParB [Alcanivorax sp.]MCH9784304.1 ParB/RepB/Spo0J family partition protein [Gammaproteobacteria bacterium]MEC8879587.1 ParB/RepB/Spo0J family partition protein [Pseudomonadota bacterium]SMO47130.1 chromosome segregation DNA-binding protein [Alcanivorax sp. DSM 26295]|tara:strand:+ start:121765 stop:122685 length:921 start_codon:yes stop_codon:yes gene_type:complete
MAAKRKRGLSKGLDALLSSNEAYQRQPEEVSVEGDGEASEQQAQRPPRDGDLRHLPVELMQRGRYQPRKDMSADALEELAESIRAQGVMQPIVVRPLGDNRYEIIAGERRWRAAQMAELDAIPAVIREVPDEAAIAMSLIENIQRENLNPMEEALALSRLKEEFGLTHQQVADAVGKSRAMVTNLLRLMSLEADVKKLLEHGDLEMGHARALLSLTGAKQVEAARTVVAKGLSVRQTETLVREFEKEKPAKPAPAKEDPNVRHLINDLSDRLGAPVQIQQGNAGKGKLVISYNNLDELDGILAHIK